MSAPPDPKVRITPEYDSDGYLMGIRVDIDYNRPDMVNPSTYYHLPGHITVEESTTRQECWEFSVTPAQKKEQ